MAAQRRWGAALTGLGSLPLVHDGTRVPGRATASTYRRRGARVRGGLRGVLRARDRRGGGPAGSSRSCTGCSAGGLRMSGSGCVRRCSPSSGRLPATATAGAAVRAVLAVAVSAGDRAVTLATRAADLAVSAVARDDADRITAQPSPSLVAPRDGRRPSVVNGARILREVGFDRGAPGKWPFPNRTATP